MGKVDPNSIGKGGAARITQDDLEEDMAILTVTRYEERKFKGAEGPETRAALYFEETGELALRLNKTQVGYLVERLGEESDAWVGEKVPIEKTQSEFPMDSGKMHDVVWVCAPEQWDRIFAEAGIAAKKSGKIGKVPGVKKVKGKRGRK